MHDIRDLTLKLFKNDYKKSDNHPDYKGIVLKDKEHLYDAGAWVSKDKNGKSFFNIKFSDVYKKADAPTQNKSDEFVDDDLPF